MNSKVEYESLIMRLDNSITSLNSRIMDSFYCTIDQIASERYKVLPSHDSMFYRWAVVAGDGTQQIYLGREAECQNMARKFAGAFLDGAYFNLKAQQVAVNQGCKYPMCHSEEYQQAVTAQLTAELWTGVVIPPGYALVPVKPTKKMIAAGRKAPCTADVEDRDADYRSVYKAMLAAASPVPKGEKP